MKTKNWVHLGWFIVAALMAVNARHGLAAWAVLAIGGSIIIDVVHFFWRVIRKIDRWLDA